jgi:hypothetical protein
MDHTIAAQDVNSIGESVSNNPYLGLTLDAQDFVIILCFPFSSCPTLLTTDSYHLISVIEIETSTKMTYVPVILFLRSYRSDRSFDYETTFSQEG